MARRFVENSRLLRSPLFFTLCFFIFAAAASVAEPGPDEPLKAVLFRSPDAPAVGGTLVITLFIDYPKTADVVVLPPFFPPSLTLERTRIEPRLLPGTSEKAERWTAVEYTFKPAEVGSHRIGAFGIRVKDKTTETAPFIVEIGGGVRAFPRRSLHWDGVPDAVHPGEPVEIRLAVEGFVPDSSSVPVVTVPENAILQGLPVSPDDAGAGTLARFRLTLLSAAPFSLPPVLLRLPDGTSLSAPSRVLSVSADPARTDPSSSDASLAAGLKGGSGNAVKPRFPEASSVPALFKRALAPVFAASRSAWATGDYVSAMAVLRKAERDSSFGLFVRQVRRDAEKELLVASAQDEPNAPFYPLVIVAVSSTLAALIAAVLTLSEVLARVPVTSARRRRFMIILIAASLAVISLGRLSYAGASGRESVVLSACRSTRVPDPLSAPSAEFSAGQAAHATAWTGEWVFVELIDGRSGWIKSACARRY